MDPRRVAEIQQAMDRAMYELTREYVQLMMRLGCRRLTLHHV